MSAHNGQAARPMLYGRDHLAATLSALHDFGDAVDRASAWGRELSTVFRRGGQVLAAGNGGSAAQAQHFTGELVGKYRDDRRPLPALALHAETSSCTAITNDYGQQELFARQVEAHGRRGDVLVLFSTSGGSDNLLEAARRGRALGLHVWALTGPVPNPLATAAHETVGVPARETATVQELHLVALHVVCAALDVALGVCRPSGALGEVSA